MIQVYNKTNTNYDANGNMTLDPTLAIFKMELNGICEIELEHPFDDIGKWKYLKVDNVIACETPYSSKQLFRIYNTVKTMTGLQVFARHIFFDLGDTVLLDTRPTDKNGQEVLDILLENTGFTGHSNISTINTAYYVRKNIVEAIASDDKNSFINRWGGERLYDNFDVYINNKIGSYNGVRVEFGRNLTEIEENIDMDSVVTRIIPLGFDGIMLTGDKPWVDSSNINNYAKIKAKVIEMPDIKVKDENNNEGFNTLAEAQAEMKKKAKELFDGGIDKPTCTYSVAMEDLSSTTEYKDYEVLEKVSIGDTVHCKHIGIGIETDARCIAIEWNILTKRYINIMLGDVVQNFFDEIGNTTNKVDQILNSNGTVKADKLNGAINALDTQFKYQKSIAQKQDVRAIIFEDADPNSELFGCMCIGSRGFEIANSYKPGTTEWDFRTFGTANGFTADLIQTGILSAILIRSSNGNTSLNLDTGEFKSLLPDGSQIVISPEKGFYNKFGNTNREYHHLMYTGAAVVTGSLNNQEVTFTLPSEFKGKNFSVFPGLQNTGNNSTNGIANLWLQVTKKDYVNGTFTMVTECRLTDNQHANIQFGYIAIA